LGERLQRAQLSVEYLLLFLLSLVLLSLFVAGISSLERLSRAYSERVAFSKASHHLLMRMEEVCVLGDGNRREVLLASPVTVEGKPTRAGKVVITSPQGWRVEEELLCPVEGAALSGRVVVANEGGLITFLPAPE